MCLMQINLGILMPFFRLYELNFRSMRFINFGNLHILTRTAILIMEIVLILQANMGCLYDGYQD